jgi:hypothetical protein
VNPLTCQAAVRAASDQLAGQLSDAERGALEEHLGGCDSCSCLMDQLYSTIAILRSRPEVQVPDWLAAMVAHTGGGRAEALTAQLPHLYALANALHADAPDAGAWVDQPVAWGEARVLGPEDDLVTTETYAAVDAALADLDPVDAGLVTLVDIEGAPLNRAALELDLSSGEARERLARARLAVRAALDRHIRS